MTGSQSILSPSILQMIWQWEHEWLSVFSLENDFKWPCMWHKYLLHISMDMTWMKILSTYFLEMKDYTVHIPRCLYSCFAHYFVLFIFSAFSPVPSFLSFSITSVHTFLRKGVWERMNSGLCEQKGGNVLGVGKNRTRVQMSLDLKLFCH